MESEESVKIDRVAYAAVVEAFASLGSAPDALRMLGRMEDLDLRPRASTYLAALRAAAAEGDAVAALSVRERLLRRSGGGRTLPSPQNRIPAGIPAIYPREMPPLPPPAPRRHGWTARPARFSWT